MQPVTKLTGACRDWAQHSTEQTCSKLNCSPQGGAQRNSATSQAPDSNDIADKNCVKDAQIFRRKRDCHPPMSDSGSFTGSPCPSGSGDGSGKFSLVGQDSEESSDGSGNASGPSDNPHSRRKGHDARYARQPQPQPKSDSDTPVSDSGSFTGSPSPSGSDDGSGDAPRGKGSQESSDGSRKASDSSDGSDNRAKVHRAKYARRPRPQAPTLRSSSKTFPLHQDSCTHLASFLLDNMQEYQNARDRGEAWAPPPSPPQQSSKSDRPASKGGGLTGSWCPTGNDDLFTVGAGQGNSGHASGPSDDPSSRTERHHARYAKRPQNQPTSDPGTLALGPGDPCVCDSAIGSCLLCVGRRSTNTRVNTYGDRMESIGNTNANFRAKQGISMLPSPGVSGTNGSFGTASTVTPEPNHDECSTTVAIPSPSAHATADSQVCLSFPRDAVSAYCLPSFPLGDTQPTHQQRCQYAHDRTENWCLDELYDPNLAPFADPRTSAASDCDSLAVPVPLSDASSSLDKPRTPSSGRDGGRSSLSLPDLAVNATTSATVPTLPRIRSMPLFSFLTRPLSLLRAASKAQQLTDTSPTRLAPAQAPNSASMKGSSPVPPRGSRCPGPAGNGEQRSSVCVHQ